MAKNLRQHNADVSVRELSESWINGNLSWVIDQVMQYDRNIVALFTLTLFRDYGESEANRFVNLLMDKCTS